MSEMVNRDMNTIDIEITPKIDYQYQVVAREEKSYGRVDYNRSPTITFKTSKTHQNQPNPDQGRNGFNTISPTNHYNQLPNLDEKGPNFIVIVIVVGICAALIIIVAGYVYKFVFAKKSQSDSDSESIDEEDEFAIKRGTKYRPSISSSQQSED